MSAQIQVYVGGPIDFAGEESAQWAEDRRWLVQALRNSGVRVFAAHEDTQPGQQTASHADGCEAAIAQAQAMVAFLPTGVVTYGTPIEIARFSATDRLVYCVGGDGSVAIQRLGVTFCGSARTAANQVLFDLPLLPVSNRLTGAAVAESLPFKMDQEVRWALPKHHYDDDAGIDLFVTEQVSIRPHEFVDVPAGCRVALPDGIWGMIVGRSSTIRRRGVMVVSGVIDTSWRGPLFVGCLNTSDRQQTITVGDRVGQLILMPNLTQGFVPIEVSELPPGQRGENGFGSTGGVNGDKQE